MSDKKCNCNGDKKSAGNNQWTTSHRKSEPDKRERKDGPGGN